jgi:tRNA(Ile)-lysidine synthase
MKRTDENKIIWPTGTSSADRRHCRDIINHVRDDVRGVVQLFVACSGGLDSTVLAHIISQVKIIQPRTHDGVYFVPGLVYINHGLRALDELSAEVGALNALSKDIGIPISMKSIVIDHDKNVQFDARQKRYEALMNLALDHYDPKLAPRMPVVVLAHHMNDVAESKLFQVLTGRDVTGMVRAWREPKSWSFGQKSMTFLRPLLTFTRADLERYAKVWGLRWWEDSSNDTDKYTRNKIRHHLIPWIEENVNPGIVKMLAGG